MTFPSKHISIAINRTSSDVYNFASRPENMPKWAVGLSDSITKEGDHWVSISPKGKVKIIFSENNDFGVKGSEVVFTLFRQPEMTEQQFNQDAGMVR